jgi:probable phosphoglycerate mutase
MANPTEIVLVRHAETIMIKSNRIHGSTDAPLTEVGIEHARKTAEYFKGQRFDAFYCSSLGRAVRTAEIIGEAIGMQPIPVDGLQERHYGWLEGKPMPLFEPDFSGPAFMYPFIKLALHVSGEREDEFPRRVVSTTEKIASDHPGQRIMMVVHWGILSTLTRHFRGEDMAGWQAVGPWTACGVSEFHKNGHGWEIIRLDDARHLG